MKLNFYSRIINRISNWQSVILASVGFFIVGVFLMIVTKPLASVIENSMGIIFLLCAVVSGVCAFAIFHSNRQNGVTDQSPLHAIIAALLFLVASGLIFFTDFFSYLFLFGICFLFFIEGLYTFLMGLEIRQTNKSSYYYLIDGLITIVATLVIFIVVLKLLRDGSIDKISDSKVAFDKKVSVGEIIIFSLALKFIFLGITTFLVAWAARKVLQRGNEPIVEVPQAIDAEFEVVKEKPTFKKKE